MGFTVLLKGIESSTLQLMTDPLYLLSHSRLHKSDGLICWSLRSFIGVVVVKDPSREHHSGKKEGGENRCF